ncbi:heme o synthase [Ampullimonas aquatilis]|uniref:heme o synthase n=1 Tax=Ampullimonas aquatilis TaxID=1341549 RepID=UPI003C77CF6A
MEQVISHSISNKLAQYYALTKPRVSQLAVFCAVIGMFLSTPELPSWKVLVAASLGIWLLAGAAFAFNCLLERKIDAKMSRTRWRPAATGDLSPLQTILFSGAIGGLGMWILYAFVNSLTMWLTLATFVGYAVIYTLLLKPATPQNIVIGGASGAMPPVLGWAAVTGQVTPEALVLFLIIFVWTPPHFWALAMYKSKDYEQSGLPMLPITHGLDFTGLHIWLYSIVLFVTGLLPYVVQMSGVLYLVSAIILGAMFLYHAWNVYRHYTDALAKKLFRFSIIYLSILFLALLVDHYVK